MKNRIGGGKTLIFSLLISSFSIAQNQSNLIDTTGNVGVGTLSPSHKLTVNGNMRVDSSFTARDSAVFEKRLRVKQDVIIHGKTIMKNDGVAKQDFRVNQTLRVDELGRFKNTVVIDSLLKVDGNVRTFGTNNYFGTSRFHNDVRLLNLNDPSGQNQEGFMMLNGNGKVERKDLIEASNFDTLSKFISIKSNGELEVVTAKTLITGIGAYEPLLCLEDINGNTYPYWKKQPDELVLKCGYRVGIGTDNPLYKLDVDGTINTNQIRVENNLSEPIFTNINNSPNTNFLILNRNSTSLNFRATSSPNFNGEWGIEYNANDGGLNFWKPWPNTSGYGNYFLFLRNDGNVGIGTPTPKYKLSVEGIIGAREIIVETAAWNDIVFEDDYPLMPLSEVKSFIKENKHLPEIPSEKEVIKEGVALKEMVSLQMKKIEELTLYVIDQQEKIEELQKQIEAIKAEGGE